MNNSWFSYQLLAVSGSSYLNILSLLLGMLNDPPVALSGRNYNTMLNISLLNTRTITKPEYLLIKLDSSSFSFFTSYQQCCLSRALCIPAHSRSP
ncbi:hypothetical protein LINGRAHAP2_LOCUS26423 [Linum grandiflorum]